jgi:hypothetical protein
VGNFYTNHTVRTTDQAAVVKVLAGRRAYVSPPSHGAVVVFDQEMMDVETLGADLSGELHCPVLAIMNHDDDILWYALFENGAKTDEYDSTPGLFHRTPRTARGRRRQ